jgi:hypothetical protein
MPDGIYNLGNGDRKQSDPCTKPWQAGCYSGRVAECFTDQVAVYITEGDHTPGMQEDEFILSEPFNRLFKFFPEKFPAETDFPEHQFCIFKHGQRVLFKGERLRTVFSVPFRDKLSTRREVLKSTHSQGISRLCPIQTQWKRKVRNRWQKSQWPRR